MGNKRRSLKKKSKKMFLNVNGGGVFVDNVSAIVSSGIDSAFETFEDAKQNFDSNNEEFIIEVTVNKIFTDKTTVETLREIKLK